MGQHVSRVVVQVDGLRIKGTGGGTFSKGTSFSVDTVPSTLVKMIKDGVTHPQNGRNLPVCSLMTPDGGTVSLSEAYVPAWEIGRPPQPTRVEEADTEPRGSSSDNNAPETGGGPVGPDAGGSSTASISEPVAPQPSSRRRNG